MAKITETYQRAKYAILHYILNFGTLKEYHKGGRIGTNDGCLLISDYEPPIGVLCMPTSVINPNPFYLAWLVQIDKSRYGNRYLLRSIEDNSLCWWENVGMSYYSLDFLSEHPTWRWNDRQFAFYDKVLKAFARRSAYSVLCKTPIFEDNGFGVTISTRTRYNSDDYSYSHYFEDFRKIKISELNQFYDNAVGGYKEYINFLQSKKQTEL